MTQTAINTTGAMTMEAICPVLRPFFPGFVGVIVLKGVVVVLRGEVAVANVFVVFKDDVDGAAERQ